MSKRRKTAYRPSSAPEPARPRATVARLFVRGPKGVFARMIAWSPPPANAVGLKPKKAR